MLEGTITFKGRTLGDCIHAIEEAASRIESEFTSGGDSNDDGSFSFDVNGEEEAHAHD